MKYDIEETLTECIMSGIPTILVEGIDDISFYENISMTIDKEVSIQAIENIEGYGQGCEEVERAINDIQEEIHANTQLKKLIMGIIDKDTRYYKGEVPNMSCLFVLEYYSYESHLTTSYSLKKLISILTQVSEKMVDDRAIEFMLQGLADKYDKLYYISLEALKGRCEAGYIPVKRYKEEPGNIFSKGALGFVWPQIEVKKEELDKFAEEKQITREDIKYVAKGKWLLYVYCNHIIERAYLLKDACGNLIKSCKYCDSGNKTKCLWRTSANFQIPQLKNLLTSPMMFDENELMYIKDRIKLLA